MSKSEKKAAGGLMSSAGLTAYHDAEDDENFSIDPKTITLFVLVVGVLLIIVNIAL